MNVLGTGLSGLVGSRIVELLAPLYSFENISKETGFDITDKDATTALIEKSQAPWVFHFAAYTDVDGAEKEKPLGNQSAAWKVNVDATKTIVDGCKKTGKHLLYISTDYVFDGTQEKYSEEDQPKPQGWYAMTKYEGEKLVAALGPLGLTIRIANPYRSGNGGKLDFAAKIREKLLKGEHIVAPMDQVFVPTFVDDIARAIDVLVSKNVSGIYHVVGDDAVSPFTAATTIAKVFGSDQTLISETTFARYFFGRAPRPFQAYLVHDRISKLGITMKTFEEGMLEVRKQV